MRVFLLLAKGFNQLPLAVARELRRRVPDFECRVLSMLPRDLFQRATQGGNFGIKGVDYLNELEPLWLNKPCEPDRLERYESMLGPAMLRRIVTADREIGAGLIHWSRVPPSYLSDCSYDGEKIRRYVSGALDYAFETLEKTRPDVVFFDAVDNGPKLAFVEVCRYLRVPCAQLSHVRLGNRYVVDDDPLGLLGPVRRM
ncbi:MAG: hypothetical protein V2B18_15560, partial [Pseudomonadota bacterium]